jgi:hypothetical protein
VCQLSQGQAITPLSQQVCVTVGTSQAVGVQLPGLLKENQGCCCAAMISLQQ